MNEGPDGRNEGTWVFVCGPSGAGKDSVIRWAQEALCDDTRIVFARRCISRPAQPGSDHEPVDAEAFEALMSSGAFRWHWRAHGFGYGIPRAYEDAIANGQLVVVNGSREHVQTLPLSPHVHVVHISADSAALEQRLAARGRDGPEAIALRLQRNGSLGSVRGHLSIVNDGELARAGQQLVDYLTSAAPCTGASATRTVSSKAS